jgi:hypothetical protein
MCAFKKLNGGESTLNAQTLIVVEKFPSLCLVAPKSKFALTIFSSFTASSPLLLLDVFHFTTTFIEKIIGSLVFT